MRNLMRLYRPAARPSAQPAANETEEQQRYESLLREIQNGADSGRIRARFAGMYQSQPEPQYIAPSVPAVYGGSATAWSPGSRDREIAAMELRDRIVEQQRAAAQAMRRRQNLGQIPNGLSTGRLSRAACERAGVTLIGDTRPV